MQAEEKRERAGGSSRKLNEENKERKRPEVEHVTGRRGEKRDKGGKREEEKHLEGSARGRKDINGGGERERASLARWNRAMDTSRPLYPAALMRNNTRDCHFEAAARIERESGRSLVRVLRPAPSRHYRCVADWKVGPVEMHRSIPPIAHRYSANPLDERDSADASGANGSEIVDKRAERIPRLALKNRESIGSRSRRRIASWIIGGLAIMSGSAPIRSKLAERSGARPRFDPRAESIEKEKSRSCMPIDTGSTRIKGRDPG